MAFKMNKFSGFGNKIKLLRAKRLAKKHGPGINPDDPYLGPEKKYEKKIRKTQKAEKLLKEAGLSKKERRKINPYGDVY